MTRRNTLGSLLNLIGLGETTTHEKTGAADVQPQSRQWEVTHTEAEWRAQLGPAQFHVLREAGTERPGASSLNREKRSGVYRCAGCALPLFDSTTKYESGTGWPSFWQAIDDAVVLESDTTLFMKRTEVLCRRCGGHLGHVFDDGPRPTGQRYCMNGAALDFAPT